MKADKSLKFVSMDEEKVIFDSDILFSDRRGNLAYLQALEGKITRHNETRVSEHLMIHGPTFALKTNFKAI